MHASTYITFRNYVQQHSYQLIYSSLPSEPSKLSNLILLLDKGMCSNSWENMRTTKSRWVVSWFLKNDKELNVLSSSTLPNTWTWAISTTLMNSESFVLLESLRQRRDIGFSPMCKDMAASGLDIIVILKKNFGGPGCGHQGVGAPTPQHPQLLCYPIEFSMLQYAKDM